MNLRALTAKLIDPDTKRPTTAGVVTGAITLTALVEILLGVSELLDTANAIARAILDHLHGRPLP